MPLVNGLDSASVKRVCIYLVRYLWPSMERMNNLNIGESLEEGKLVFSESFSNKTGDIMLYVVLGFFVLLPFYLLLVQSQLNPVFYLLFFLAGFSLYIIYRKAVEKRLISMSSRYGLKKNIALIRSYCENKGMTTIMSSENCAIFSEADFFYLDSEAAILRVFLFKNNEVYFTIVKDNPRVNLPVVTRYFLRNDLKQMLI